MYNIYPLSHAATKNLRLGRVACIYQKFEVVSCQNNGSCHMSRWTFAELSHGRMEFVELVLVRMEFCRIFTCPKIALHHPLLSEKYFHFQLSNTLNKNAAFHPYFYRYLTRKCFEPKFQSIFFKSTVLYSFSRSHCRKCHSITPFGSEMPFSLSIS